MGEVKPFLRPANFTPGLNATLNTEIHKTSVRIKVPTQSMHQSESIKIKLISRVNEDEYSLQLYCVPG